jgi:hypothetical protein
MINAGWLLGDRESTLDARRRKIAAEREAAEWSQRNAQVVQRRAQAGVLPTYADPVLLDAQLQPQPQRRRRRQQQQKPQQPQPQPQPHHASRPADVQGRGGWEGNHTQGGGAAEVGALRDALRHERSARKMLEQRVEQLAADTAAAAAAASAAPPQYAPPPPRWDVPSVAPVHALGGADPWIQRPQQPPPPPQQQQLLPPANGRRRGISPRGGGGGVHTEAVTTIVSGGGGGDPPPRSAYLTPRQMQSELQRQIDDKARRKAVSRSCIACIGWPCLRQCVHGASIGGRTGGAGRGAAGGGAPPTAAG